MKYRNCPICSGKSGEVLHNLKFELLEGVELPDNYDIVICDCGFVFADTPATQVDYDRFYRDHNIYEGEASYSDMEKYTDIFGLLSKEWDRDKKILEVGFANGELLGMFKEVGYRYLTGLDPSARCVDRLNKSEVSAYQGGLLNHNLKSKFDCLIASHVLEHVLDLRGAVRSIFDLLEFGGEVYIETPDLRQYKENSDTPFSYFDIEHINHFTLKSLCNLVEICGLRIMAGGQKKWAIGGGKFYPAVWVMACKPFLLADNGIRAYVGEYISKSLRKQYPVIEKLIESQEEIIVWGAGSLAQRLYSMARLGDCNIKMYVDNDANKVNSYLGGRRVCSPSDINGNNRILILAVYAEDEIEGQIRSMGLENEVVHLDK